MANWELGCTYRCRLKRHPEGFRDHMSLERLANGEECPVEGKIAGEIISPSPADNIAGPIAAEKFSAPCPLCGKVADKYDFSIG